MSCILSCIFPVCHFTHCRSHQSEDWTVILSSFSQVVRDRQKLSLYSVWQVTGWLKFSVLLALWETSNRLPEIEVSLLEHWASGLIDGEPLFVLQMIILGCAMTWLTHPIHSLRHCFRTGSAHWSPPKVNVALRLCLFCAALEFERSSLSGKLYMLRLVKLFSHGLSVLAVSLNLTPSPIFGVWVGEPRGRKWYQSKCRPYIPIRLLCILLGYLAPFGHNSQHGRQTRAVGIGCLCYSIGGLKLHCSHQQKLNTLDRVCNVI